MIHVEDAFITGILGRVLGLEFFAAPLGTFTHMHEIMWWPAQILEDKRVLGTSLTEPGQFRALWALLLYHGEDGDKNDDEKEDSLKDAFRNDTWSRAWRTMNISDLKENNLSIRNNFCNQTNVP
ncbi:hypothetical protein PoB_002181800 [Plakobranchus ocellatus]|uniref:Uncharacterized protein n=1 Tax=Plakobranchus ocellatus TaxID=259542 RepID=A0AAV3ZKF1_9GAST|nr:hypothetical protein PoB_002181800 [Plakobranchus ocellatus]